MEDEFDEFGILIKRAEETTSNVDVDEFGIPIKKNESSNEEETSLDSELEVDSLDTKEETTEDPKENTEEDSFWTDTLMAGLNDFNKTLSSIPESLYTIASIPQNAVAYLTGLDISTNADKFKEMTGVSNPIYDSYIDEGERLQKKIDSFTQENYENSSVSENISNGKYQDAFELLSASVIRSAPTSLGIMAGGATMKTAELVGAMSVAFTEENRRDFMQENPEMSDIEAGIKAVEMAGAEAVFASIGQAKIGAIYKDILTKAGKEEGTKIFKTGIQNVYEQALRKSGAIAGTLGESFEESATQITQNMIKGRPYMEGVMDAFLIGGASGGVMTAPMNVVNARGKLKTKLGEKKLQRNIESKGSGGVLDAFTDTETASDVKIEIAGNKYSRGLLEKDLKSQVKEGSITEERKEEFLNDFDESAGVLNSLEGIELSDDNKIKAVELIKEKNKLKREVEGVEKALVKGKFEKISEIDSQLEALAGIESSESESESDAPVAKEETEVINEDSEQVDEEIVEDVFDSEELGEYSEENVQEKEVFMETEQAEKVNTETNETTDNEAQTQGDTIIDDNLRSDTGNSEQQDVQPTVDDTTSEGEVEVKTKKAKPVVSENLNYQIKRGKDGAVDVFNRDGSHAEVTGATKSKYVEEYIDKTDFDTGARAINENTPTSVDPVKIVADLSENPAEIAETLANNGFDVVLDDRQEAIARNVSGISRESFNDAVGYSKKKEGVSQSYFSKDGKGLDEIQFAIISELGLEYDAKDPAVTIDEITDFMLSHKGSGEYLNQKSESQVALLGKFEELTGLKASHKNIQAVASTQEVAPEVVEDTAPVEDEVPFQVNKLSSKKKITGKKLNKLVNRLKKTKLAKSVKVLNTASINKVLQKAGVSEKVLKQEGENVNLKKWVGKKDVVNGSDIGDVKTGEPVVVRVYHGTTNEFYEFDSTEKGNIDGHLGRVNYFTSEFHDASGNYQADGADLTNRIENKTDEVTSDIEMETDESFEQMYDYVSDRYPDFDVSSLDEDVSAMELADKIVRSELDGGVERILEVFVKLENPVVLGRGRSWVEVMPRESYEDSMDDAVTEIADENGITEEEAKEDYSWDIEQRAMEIEGVENPFIEALDKAIRDNSYDGTANGKEASEILMDFTYDEDIDLNQLEKTLREELAHTTNEDGEMSSAQIISDLFENLGYDGIVLNNVAQRFQGMGLGSNTSHVHVFNKNSNQIKLADGTNTTFNEDTKDIRFQKELEKNGIQPTVYGFVLDGEVYLNEDTVQEDTPIHEFAHLWVSAIKKSNPELHQKGLDLISEESSYLKAVQENPAYSKLTEKQQLEEALVQAIGDRGALLWGKKKKQFKQFLNDLKNWLGTTFFKDYKGDFSNVDLDAFLDASVGDLLSGKDLGIEATKNVTGIVRLASKPEANLFNDESLVEKNKELKKLYQMASNSYKRLKTNTSRADAIRKDLRETIKEYFNKENIKDLQGRDLTRILSAIDKAKTKAKLEKAIATFEDVALKAERRGIKIKYKQRFKDLKQEQFEDFKKELQTEVDAIAKDFFKEKLSNKNLKGATRAEVERIYNLLKNPKTTDKQVKNLAKQLENLFYTLESRKVMSNINKILKRKLTKNESGRRKANLTDEQSTKVITGVKSILREYAVGRKGVSRSDKSSYDVEFLLTLIESQKEFMANVASLNNDEINSLTSINVAIGIINGKTITDPQAKLSSLIEAETELNNIYNEGRSKHLDWVLQKRNEKNEFIKAGVDANNINGKSITPSKETVIKNRNSLISGFSKMLYNWTSGKDMGDLDTALQIIDKKGGKNINEGFAQELSEDIKDSATKKEYNLRKYSESLKKKQREIFGGFVKGRGSDTKMNNILNKNHSFTVMRPELNLETGELDMDNLEPVELQLSESQLLNLWMHYKNPEVHAGFETAGYDQAFMDNADKVLNSKSKEYGEFLFEFYEDYYDHINATYKEMYGHSLGKPQFYAGKLARAGFSETEVNLMDGIATARTTAGGSTKERVSSKLPVEAQGVNEALSKYLFESEHFVQYAPIHSKFDALIRDKRFKNSVMANNPNIGDAVLEQLVYYRDLEMVRGGKERESLRVMDVFMANFVKSTLAIKPKIALTQTLSIPNMIKFLPRGKNGAKGLNPATFVSDAKHIFKNSKYIENRLDSNTLNKAITGLNSVSMEEVFSSKGGNGVKQFMRGYDAVQNTLMLNVKLGDMVGVMGSFPVYSGWKAEYLSRGLDPAIAEVKAMKKFESAVDRAQQGQTKFSKSKLQNNPIGKYFAMFATSPMQNYRNAVSSYIEVGRYLKKNQQMKGSLARHLVSIANFSVAQPLLYTWIAGRIKGGLGFLFEDNDDEITEAEKSMLSALILRNSASIPIAGSTMLLVVDELLEKEHTFGAVLNSPVMQEADKIKSYFDKAKRAKTESSKQSNYKMMQRSFKKLLTGLPIDTAEKYRFLFKNWDTLNDEYDMTEMIWMTMGHSQWAIDNDRKGKTKESSKKSSASY